MTLPEVLIVIIVSAVVFLSVMDGTGLLVRHTQDIAGRLTGNMDFYNGYYRLQDIITMSDSITSGRDKLYCWRDDGVAAELIIEDSVLTVRHGSLQDTLVRGIVRFGAYTAGKPETSIDSLKLWLTTTEGIIQISFDTDTPVATEAKRSIEDKEEGYEYE